MRLFSRQLGACAGSIGSVAPRFLLAPLEKLVRRECVRYLHDDRRLRRGALHGLAVETDLLSLVVAGAHDLQALDRVLALAGLERLDPDLAVPAIGRVDHL